MTVCENCGFEMPPAASTGRPRRFCSARCRVAAKRERDTWTVGEPVVDAPPMANNLIALDALLDETPAPPEERLARAVLETRNLSHGFRTVAREVRPALRVRAQKVADALDATVEENFGGLL